jgi:serine protease
MARMSRLLSAVCLGIAATAAVAAVAITTEYNKVHRSPTHRAESTSNARVIVKFKERASILSVSNSTAGSVVTGPQKAGVLGGRLGLSLSDGRVLGARTQVVKASGMTSAALAQAIGADTDVEWAEVDQRRYAQVAPVNDPLYPDNLSTSVAPTGPSSGQWYLRAPGIDARGTNVVSSINIEPAWAITHGATSIVIGDVDTGITVHPDLTANNSKIIAGYDFISDATIANDGNALDSDPSDAGDYVTATENSSGNANSNPFFGCNDDGVGGKVAENSTWHGTQTAGILGASTNNATGMAGTAYDVPVIPARALGKCGGYDSDIIAAAQWVGGIAPTSIGTIDGVNYSAIPTNPHPARVINMSLGASGACTSAYIDAFTALRNKGVIIVVAAGNDEGLAVGTPANCKPLGNDTNQTPLVIAVAALRQAGTKVGFSDIGPEVTISAPGGNCINTGSTDPCLYPIITTRNSGTTTPVVNGGTYSDGLNNYSLGTSFATPMVAGTVALMLSAAPNLTNALVIDIIKTTSRRFPTTSDSGSSVTACRAPTSVTQDECLCTTSTCGAGMLDAGAAVTAAAALSTGTPVNYTWPTAVATSTATTVVAGSSITLDGSTSLPGSSGAAVTYKWSIQDADTHVTLGSSTGSTVTVTGASAGTALVQLSVTDPTSGLVNSSIVSITVTGNSSGGGGGGAANPAWLAALAIAGLLLGSRGRRERA